MKRQAALPEITREVVAKANNSLYGSDGFFLSINGGEPDKYHLARPIEDLKALGNRLWQENARLREALSIIVAEWDARCDPGDDWPSDAIAVMNDAYKADFISKARAALAPPPKGARNG